jgi:HAD superfamily hydrolase (TIGR01458 family)
MINSILFDIDGTLVAREQALPGAVEAVRNARYRGLSVRFLTNITGRSPAAIAAGLQALGFDIESHEIQTATTACVEHLKSRPAARCHLIVPQSILPLFEGIRIDDNNPDVVVIADIGEQFDFRVLNRAFLMVRAGAELVVPQKGLFWFDKDGPKLDCGSFIVGLEAATGKCATVTGKPSAVFFERAMAHIGCRPAEVLVIGDDASTDVAGAAGVGARAALVATGKYYPGAELVAGSSPDFFLRSMADLPALLERLAGVNE